MTDLKYSLIDILSEWARSIGLSYKIFPSDTHGSSIIVGLTNGSDPCDGRYFSNKYFYTYSGWTMIIVRDIDSYESYNLSLEDPEALDKLKLNLLKVWRLEHF